jgi:hypothetical protein
MVISTHVGAMCRSLGNRSRAKIRQHQKIFSSVEHKARFSATQKDFAHGKSVVGELNPQPVLRGLPQNTSLVHTLHTKHLRTRYCCCLSNTFEGEVHRSRWPLCDALPGQGVNIRSFSPLIVYMLSRRHVWVRTDLSIYRMVVEMHTWSPDSKRVIIVMIIIITSPHVRPNHR